MSNKRQKIFGNDGISLGIATARIFAANEGEIRVVEDAGDSRLMIVHEAKAYVNSISELNVIT